MHETRNSAETVADALGRSIPVSPRAERIVSLVPSETESVAALAGVGRLVGRTRYCEEPNGAMDDVPTVGGTKDIDEAAVLALDPDLVLANQEENSRPAVTALIEAGVRVHVSFPKTVAEGLVYVRTLGRFLGTEDANPHLIAARELERELSTATGPRLRAFVPIWKDPWMTFNDDTFAASLLRTAGITNVFADRERRTPLAADLGLREEARTRAAETRDRRYPRMHLREAIAANPDLVLVPDEPYDFTIADVQKLREAFPRATVIPCSGKDLFWYGTRIPGAIERLRALVAHL